MGNGRWWLTVMLLGCSTGKQESTTTKHGEAATAGISMSGAFWSEAPAATDPRHERTFAYQPDKLQACKISVDMHSQPGSTIALNVRMMLDLAFEAAAVPGVRAVKVAGLDMHTDVGGKPTEMMWQPQELVIKDGTQEKRIKRGDAGPLKVEDVFDRPFATLTIGPDNTLTSESSAPHPFTASGAEIMTNALMMFPDLPAAPVRAGHRWEFDRSIRIPGSSGTTKVRFGYEYVGEAPCPSGAASCVQLAFQATSPEVTANGATTKLSVNGKVFLDLARGMIDEARMRIEFDTRHKDATIVARGMYTLTTK